MEMQINKIKIDNFKGISSIEFRPKKINLIVGRNNTGKTTLLESVYLLFNPNEIKEIYPKYTSEIIKSGSRYSEIAATLFRKKTKISLKIMKPEREEAIRAFEEYLIKTFEDVLKKNKIEISEKLKEELEKRIQEWTTPELISYVSKTSLFLIENNNKKKEVYSLNHRGESRQILEIVEKSIKYLKSIPILKSNRNILHNLDEVKYQFLFEMLEAGEYLHTDVDFSSRNVFLVKNLLEALKYRFKEAEDSQQKKKKILDMEFDIEPIIKRYILVENFERFEFDYVRFKDKSLVPFSFLGDGFKTIVSLLCYCVSLKNINGKIILLDEPEIHMHPGYVKELVKFIVKFSREKNIQFFISTHSMDIIDIFLDADIFSKEDREYLENELLVLRMDKIGDQNLSEWLNYEGAKNTKDELLLDLRGI